MADPIEPMTDEALNSLVQLVEAGELLGKTLDISVSRAVRIMLTSWQVMARLQQRSSLDFLSRMPTKETKQ